VNKHKATAISPANIAFIKYWGWKSESNKKLIIPANDSISMNLSNCLTTTTVEFSPLLTKDSIKINFFKKNKEKKEKREKSIKEKEEIPEIYGEKLEKVIAQVNRLRKIKNIDYPVKIVSENSFPADAGIASSASAFSALTLACAQALDLDWSSNRKKLSVETRLSGSGSACRSVVDGFAYWQKNNTPHNKLQSISQNIQATANKNSNNNKNSQNCYAYELANENHWNLVDIVVVVDTKKKEISSREGHNLAVTSPYYKARLTELPSRIKNIKHAILEKNFKTFGKLIEQEAISMHTVCMTSNPPIFYLNNKTFEVIQALKNWRKEGLFGYFTIDAGPNLHVMCQEKDAQILNSKLNSLKSTLFTIVNKPCKGTRLTDKHLF